ncbi:uncharacterized protein LOC133409208 [Phycodurus eques]|uniref:uncharacterized protein LOC133409208 n=1 Tax=Phycodurus eques TaxID=693459 RepID=UPI002ACE9565|nr:uncharacterized protein LOC133409208 [Phycodurus eques]
MGSHLKRQMLVCHYSKRERESELSVCYQRIITMGNSSTVKIPDGSNLFYMSPLFWVPTGLLVLSLSCNIFFCFSKSGCSEKITCWSRIRRSRRPQQMEDNPIYGNVNCMQTSTTAISEINPPHLTVSSSSLKDQLSSNSDSQSKTTDCYANLSLKAPKSKPACSSPEIQYSVVFQSDELREEVKGNVHAAATVSDVYASVQTKRTKNINNADSAEDDANHIGEEP